MTGATGRARLCPQVAPSRHMSRGPQGGVVGQAVEVPCQEAGDLPKTGQEEQSALEQALISGNSRRVGSREAVHMHHVHHLTSPGMNREILQAAGLRRIKVRVLHRSHPREGTFIRGREQPRSPGFSTRLEDVASVSSVLHCHSRVLREPGFLSQEDVRA